MEVAHDLKELKELISRLGLRDDRREFPRYKVDISGNYCIEQGGISGFRDTCRLVDASRRGVTIKIKNIKFHEGTILHLQFSKGLNPTDVAGKVVHIDRKGDEYLVGVHSLSKNIDIINQLFSE